MIPAILQVLPATWWLGPASGSDERLALRCSVHACWVDHILPVPSHQPAQQPRAGLRRWQAGAICSGRTGKAPDQSRRRCWTCWQESAAAWVRDIRDEKFLRLAYRVYAVAALTGAAAMVLGIELHSPTSVAATAGAVLGFGLWFIAIAIDGGSSPTTQPQQ